MQLGQWLGRGPTCAAGGRRQVLGCWANTVLRRVLASRNWQLPLARRSPLKMVLLKRSPSTTAMGDHRAWINPDLR